MKLTAEQQRTAKRQLRAWLSSCALVAFANQHKLLLSSPTWRMVSDDEQKPGQINALPLSRGILRATDGILCIIEQPHSQLYIGHLQYWQPERHSRIGFGSSNPHNQKHGRYTEYA